MKIIYRYNGVNLKDYGVSVSKGRGFIGRPERKEPKKYEYPDEHGYIPDLTEPVFKAREITLDCFIIANNSVQLISQFDSFTAALLEVTDTVALAVAIEGVNVYSGDVYASEISELNKTFEDGRNVGTFTVTIIEPNPTI